MRCKNTTGRGAHRVKTVHIHSSERSHVKRDSTPTRHQPTPCVTDTDVSVLAKMYARLSRSSCGQRAARDFEDGANTQSCRKSHGGRLGGGGGACGCNCGWHRQGGDVCESTALAVGFRALLAVPAAVDAPEVALAVAFGAPVAMTIAVASAVRVAATLNPKHPELARASNAMCRWCVF